MVALFDVFKKLSGEKLMSINLKSEKALLEGLDAHTVHADELAQPLPAELTPLERLKGSVKRYDRPTDPVWDEYFDSEGVSGDFMEGRDQMNSDDRIE